MKRHSSRSFQHALFLVLALAVPASAVGLSDAGERRVAPPPLRAVDAAAEIDRLVELGLDRAGQERLDSIDDATFVRRAYLEIAGRIPTAAETRAFLGDGGRDKRAELIDELLDSPAWVSSMFHFWADLLRVRTRLNNRVSGEPWIHFIKQSLAENRPYDQFVRDMLGAEGAAHARDNGATGYYLRDRGMPVDNMSITLRVFLGSRLECAQCHNHPFADWKQKEFFEMVAFTGGIVYRDDLRDTEHGAKLQAVRERAEEEIGRNGRRAFGQLADTYTVGVSSSGTGYVRLPHDYQYEDASPDQWIAARALFGDQVDLQDQLAVHQQVVRNAKNPRQRNRRFRPQPSGSRDAFADWMTSPSNPLFTRVIANRMWKRVLGRGLIEPVDDLEVDTVAVHPELMAHLEELMVEVGYDLKAFLRILYNTRTWQSAAFAEELDPDQPYLFPGPVLERMDAEQIWDSLLTLVVPDVDGTLQDPLSNRTEAVYANYEEFTALDEKQMLARVEAFAMRYEDPEGFRAMQRERQMDARAERDALREQAAPIIRDLRRARRKKDDAAEQDALAALAEIGVDPPEMTQRLRALQGLVRASDLSTPAPADHLVRQFGQSDREQVQGSHTDASVPQILSLMNGFVESKILRNQYALLVQGLRGAGTAEAKIRLGYLSILSRPPGRAEIESWKPDFDADPDQASADLVWTLLNTHEFLFIR